MKRWIIILVIAVVLVGVLAGAGVYVFRDQPLIPEGYTIERIGGGISIGDVNATDSITINVDPGRTLLNNNSSFYMGILRSS